MADVEVARAAPADDSAEAEQPVESLRPAPALLGPPEGDDDDARGGAGPRGVLDDLARELSLADQERQALADNYFQSGKSLYSQLRYREAATYLERAVKLHAEVGGGEGQELLNRTMFILGDRKAAYKEVVRDLVRERESRISQASAEIERLFREGELLMERQRYEEARERFERVLEAVRWFPYQVDNDSFADRARGKIAEAKRLAEDQERHRRFMLQEASRQAKEAELAVNRRTMEATLRAIYEDARDAFRAEKYEKCMRLCYDVLQRRPGYEEAETLLEEAREARHRAKVLKAYRDRVEHLRRQVEWIDESAVPYQEIFRFPGASEWAEISARNVPIAEILAKRRQDSGEADEIRRRLASQRITLNFDETPFDEAIDFLRDITGLNIVVSSEARDLIDGEGLTVTLRLRDVTLDNALRLILAQSEELVWRIEDGVIKIGTEDDVTEELILEFYDVTEIVSTPPDFPAPELGLSLNQGGGGAGGQGGVLSFGDDDGDDVSSRVDADTLIELIESKLGEDDDEGDVEYSGGILIVRKSLASHEKIIKLLDALRRTVGVMCTVEARFVQIQDNWLEQVGIDIVNQPGAPPVPPADTFGQINTPRGTTGGPQNVQVGYNYIDAQGQTSLRGATVNALSSLAPPGLPFNITRSGGLSLQYNFLDDFQLQAVLEVVRKTQKQEVVNAPRITVFNGQRSHILNILQRAYIQDVEVNQTGVIPVLNPVIGIINSGAILEVRPTVSHDRRYTTLEVQPTLATELPPRIPAPVTLGAATSIPIELPVITIQKLRATVTVPDGGTVLLGGLKNFDEFEGESGVPFLMNVPVINNLFKRNASQRLRASLVVLIRSNITVIRDEEERKFGR